MADTQKDHTQEELRQPEMYVGELVSEKTSATETLISVDDTSSEEPLLGSTEKDHTQEDFRIPELYGGELAAIKSREDEVFEDLLLSNKPEDLTFDYLVPEQILPLDGYQPGYPRLAALQIATRASASIANMGGYTTVFCYKLRRSYKCQRETLGATINSRWKEKEMLAEAKAKLAEYDSLLFRLQKKLAMKKPTRAEQNSVMDFVFPSLTAGYDRNWICRTDDLVVLADEAERSWIFEKIMNFAQRYLPTLTATIFRTRAQRIVAGKVAGLHLYCPARLETFARALLTMFATALALAPLYALDLLRRDQALTVYLSTLGFYAFCAICAKASRSQLFAATAGYLALQVLAMILSPERQIITRKSSL